MTLRLVGNNIGTMQNEKVIGFNPSLLNSKEGIESVTDWVKDIINSSKTNTWSQFELMTMDRKKIKMYNAFRYYDELQECEYQGEDILHKKRELVPPNELATELVMRIKKEFC